MRPAPPWTPTTRTCARSAGTSLIDHWHELFLEDYPEMDKYLEEITYKFQKKIVKAWLLEGHRVDGRAKNEIRPLAAEVGVLPRVHGSGLFTRGQTQVLSVCTLNTLSAAQKLDTIWEEEEKRLYAPLQLPPPTPPARPGRPLHQPPREGPRRPGRAGPGAGDPSAWRTSPTPSAW